MGLLAWNSDNLTETYEGNTNTELLVDYLQATYQLLARDNISVAVHRGLTPWVEVIRQAPGNVGVNPTFDCTIQEIDDEDGFSFHLLLDGMPVAIMACRRFVTDSYYDLVSSGRVWYAEPDFRPLPIQQSGRGPSGIVSHTGGLWVHPDHRGIGLSWVLPRMIGATAVALWGIDWHTGMVFANLNKTKISQRNYGSTANKVLIEGFFPPTGRLERIFSNETPGGDIVERTRRDTVEIRRDRYQKVRDLAPIANKRMNQPAIPAHAAGKEAV